MSRKIQSLEEVRCFTTETEKELYKIMGGASSELLNKWNPDENKKPGPIAYPCYGVAPRTEIM